MELLKTTEQAVMGVTRTHGMLLVQNEEDAWLPLVHSHVAGSATGTGSAALVPQSLSMVKIPHNTGLHWQGTKRLTKPRQVSAAVPDKPAHQAPQQGAYSIKGILLGAVVGITTTLAALHIWPVSTSPPGARDPRTPLSGGTSTAQPVVAPAGRRAELRKQLPVISPSMALPQHSCKPLGLPWHLSHVKGGVYSVV